MSQRTARRERQRRRVVEADVAAWTPRSAAYVEEHARLRAERELALRRISTELELALAKAHRDAADKRKKVWADYHEASRAASYAVLGPDLS